MDDGATKHGGQSLQPGNNQSRASATSLFVLLEWLFFATISKYVIDKTYTVTGWN